ncbi:hypothetical protein ES702_07239 [subsurface metagenome]
MQRSPLTKEDSRSKNKSQCLSSYLIKKVLLDKAGRRCAHCYRKTVPVRLARVRPKKGRLTEDGYCLLCHDCILKRQEKRKQAKKRLWHRKAASRRISKTGFFNRIRKNVLQRDGYRCLWCGTKEKIGLGSLIPESRGGKLTFDNFIASCQKCRPSKGNKLPLNFLFESITVDEFLHEELDEHLRVSNPGNNTTVSFYLLAEVSSFLHALTNNKEIPSHTRSRAEQLNIKLVS